MKLSVKISALVTLVSIIPAIIVMAYTLKTIQLQSLNSAVQDVLNRVEISAERLSNELQSSQRMVETYVQMGKIQSMDPQQFLPFLSQEVARHNGNFEKFIVATPDGHFYNTAGGNPDQYLLRTFDDTNPAANPKNIRKRDYWQHLIKDNPQQSHRSIISMPMMSYTTGARQVVIASTIIKEQKLAGMLGAAIDWDRVLTLIKNTQEQQFSSYGWQAKMFLVSRDGTYWYHWNPRFIASLATESNGELLYDENGQTITRTHSLADEIHMSPEKMADIASGVAGFYPYQDQQDDSRVYLFHAPIGANGYTLGLTVNEQDLLPPLVNYLSVLMIFLVTLVLVLILANAWHRRNITTPLATLMTYIQQLGHGKYQQNKPQLNNDEFSQVAATLNDMAHAITDRQQALKESETRFECAMAGTNDGLWDWDIETRHIYYSPRWCEMLGYQQQELASDISTFSRLLHPQDRQGCEDYIDRFLRGEIKQYHLNFRMQHKNGSIIYILSRAFLIRDEITGEPVRVIGTHVDVTDAKLHEQRIHKLNEELEQRVQQRTEELEKANRRLEEISLRDSLTQLGNRRAMEADLINEFSGYQRHRREYAIMLIDIDHFKTYNDHYGHPKGDEVLRNIAGVMARSVRKIDRVYRYGGEEFLVLMPDTDQKVAAQIAERTRANVCQAVEPHNQSPEGHITISIGLSAVQQADIDWQAAINRADKHLYAAKQAGRNKVVSTLSLDKAAAFADESVEQGKLH